MFHIHNDVPTISFGQTLLRVHCEAVKAPRLEMLFFNRSFAKHQEPPSLEFESRDIFLLSVKGKTHLPPRLLYLLIATGCTLADRPSLARPHLPRNREFQIHNQRTTPS